MSHTTIVLTLPETVVQNFRQIAAAGNRTVEEIMIETLTSHQPVIADYEVLLTPLAAYTDEQLWAVVDQRLTPVQQQRLDALNNKLEASEAFLDSESAEITQLTRLIQLQMRLRSRALALLHERGQDTEAYLNTLEENNE